MVSVSPKTSKLLAWLILPAVFLILLPAAQAQNTATTQTIDELNQQIKQKKNQLELIQQQQQDYQKQIQIKANEQVTLKNQLSILSDQISQAQLDINSVQIKISQNNLEKQKINFNTAQINKRINKASKHLAALLDTMYRQDRTSTLETLLLNNSLSDFLNQVKYLADTSKDLKSTSENLKKQKSLLDADKAALEQKQNTLKQLTNQLQQKQDDLTYEQQSKQDLLNTSNNSEQKYQALLQKGLQQQRQAENDISTAEQQIRKQLSKNQQNTLNSNSNTFIWPVDSHTITTAFHDPDYPFRTLIGEHSGVDIRAAQGTVIRAVADGYVATIKFKNNSNYAYIMLIHGHGLATLYGHVSAVFVTTDQYVTQGEPIGRTGGTPGSIGSGPFTTGPHLHFEVRLNGLPVNPMNYLP